MLQMLSEALYLSTEGASSQANNNKLLSHKLLMVLLTGSYGVQAGKKCLNIFWEKTDHYPACCPPNL